ncbi:MAG TPA: arylsulfatase, partial [Acidobacteriota bacterium]|nr:arylsulfatase [Acidobacteriota bacterium]
MKKCILFFIGLIIVTFGATASMLAQDKPNILVVWGDDVGQSNISAYTKGMMGYR